MSTERLVVMLIANLIKNIKKIMGKIRKNRREEYPLIGYLVDKRWR